MSKIIIDRDELERIRESVDYLLEKGRKEGTLKSPEQQAVSDITYGLDDKEKRILEYLKKNPGSTKEDIVKNLKAYSRVTILKAISRLLEKGVVIKVPKDKKGRINHLYVNYKNAIFSLQENLGIFHYYYLGLIDKVIEVICSKLSEKGKIEYKIMSCVGLLYKLLELYKLLCIVYITSDIFLWSKRPLDNDTLHSKFEHFFNTMKDIHLELRKIPAAMRIKPEDGEEIVCNMLCSSRYGGSKQDLLKMLKYFERYNLCEDFEHVVDSFWVLSYSILPSIDSTYKKHQKNGTLRDWREIFKGSYHPKTEQDRALFQPGTDLEEGA